MTNRTEIINENYHGHTYELTCEYAQKYSRDILVSEHLAKAGVTVDGKRIYGGTPGFRIHGSDMADVRQAVICYIDFLEEPSR